MAAGDPDLGVGERVSRRDSQVPPQPLMAVAVGQLRPRAAGWLQSRRPSTQALSTWVLTLVLVLYLAFHSAGYAIATYAQVSIVVWWIIAVCAAWGLLPVVSPSRDARASKLLRR
jgi:hypothetical protein